MQLAESQQGELGEGETKSELAGPGGRYGYKVVVVQEVQTTAELDRCLEKATSGIHDEGMILAPPDCDVRL